jgi:hypothetical protein
MTTFTQVGTTDTRYTDGLLESRMRQKAQVRLGGGDWKRAAIGQHLAGRLPYSGLAAACRAQENGKDARSGTSHGTKATCSCL